MQLLHIKTIKTHAYETNNVSSVIFELVFSSSQTFDLHCQKQSFTFCFP